MSKNHVNSIGFGDENKLTLGGRMTAIGVVGSIICGAMALTGVIILHTSEDWFRPTDEHMIDTVNEAHDILINHD